MSTKWQVPLAVIGTVVVIGGLIVLCLYIFTDLFKTESEEGGQDTSNDDTGSDPDNPSKVVLGVFMKESDGTYTRQNVDDIELQIQSDCQGWSRNTMGGVNYNAASNVVYDKVNESVTWLEFGPESSEQDALEICQSNTLGASKSADKINYAPATNSENNRAYLRIVSVL